MTLPLFALQLLNGVEYGLLLFLVASGLTLIFGVLGVLNFAHGSFYMLGAYLAYWIGERTGSLAWAIAAGVPLMFAAGWLVERLAISRLYGRDHLSQLLLTYGMVLLFNELQRALFGNEVHGVATPRPLAFGIRLGELQSWPAYRAFTCVACLLVAAAIRHVLLRTRFGMRVRAGAVNPEMVEALGVDVRRLLSILFSAGTALAALAGILAAPRSAGRARGHPGQGAAPRPLQRDGLRRHGRGAALAAARAVRPACRGAMTLPRSVRAGLLVGTVALALVPLSGDRFWVQFAGKVMVTCIFAVSLDLLVGYAGLVSLAHSAFFGLSAYLLAGLTNQLGLVSPLATLPLCVAFAALAALSIGWVSLRATGVYFVMVTLAFAQMLYYLFSESPALGGSDGVSILERPRLAVLGRTVVDLGDGTAAYAAIWVALVLSFVLLRRIVRAPFGRVLTAIRINEPRMRTLGYATRRYKLAAFVLGGALAGLAGYLDATLYGFVNPAQFGWRQSGLVLVTVLLGGKGTLYGPALGAVLLSVLEHFAERATEHWSAVVGAAVVAVVLFLPRGVAGLLEGGRG